MDNISTSVVKTDHSSKMSGQALYCGDFDSTAVLCGKLLRSKYARAKVLSVRLPELPDGYYYIGRHDVPGQNHVKIFMNDTPVYANEIVEYIGEPIGMLCGPDERLVKRLLEATEVEYEALEPALDLRKADHAFFDFEYGKGDIQRAFAEADKVYEEEFETGHQEQAYLETQALMAEPEPDGGMLVHGSMQCPYYLHDALVEVLGCEYFQLHIRQDATGGGFGGKEDYPSILACQIAVAARKCNRPVRCVLDRREDMECTSKRHPSLNTYRLAVKDGRVTAMDIDIKLNAGAYTTLSSLVLVRSVVSAGGVYNIENLHVRGRALKTNTTPNGAYRGFGGPQVFFSLEMMMCHIAKDLSCDDIAFREKHFVKQGDASSTSGKFHFHVPLPEMLDEVDKLCELRRKHKEYSKPQAGRFRKGIGVSMFFHGAGVTGSAEKDAVVRLRKFKDGSVQILASNTDIGQGLRTTFPKIVANELHMPLSKVSYDYPDTARVPDSGPTVGSRSMMIVGELLRKAAIKLAEQWEDGKEQLVEERYTAPDFLIPYRPDTFQGDAFPNYAWGVNAIELELDTYTGFSKILGAYASFDVGTPIDYSIVTGQMEGGYLQGIGHASMEAMSYDSSGRILNASFKDYLIPTSMDVPKLQVLLHEEKYSHGPYGAKGAGELPLVGAAPAYLSALEMAMGGTHRLNHIPFTAEDSLMELAKETE